MQSPIPFRVLCGVVGVLFTLIGLILFASFFAYQVPGSTPAVSTGPMGHYFIAFTGCALVAWGLALVNGARRPDAAEILAVPTAFGLVLMAVFRMVGWVVGDYYLLGSLLRFEAGLFLLMALAFVWLRPGPATIGEAA
jgi:hypothetical protein